MPGHEKLLALIDRFRGCKIAVLGDMVVDEFVYGDIARVSREAPVLILDHRRTEIVPGGGGNAVANLRALGADPLPVGVVGKDDPGRRLLDRFAGMGIATGGIRAEAGYETPTKSRVLAGGVHTRRQQLVRVDRGTPHGALGKKVLRGLGSRLRKTVSRAEGLLIADYGYGAATPELVAGLTGARRISGFPVTVDSRTRTTSYRNLSACTPNQEELENVLGLDGLAGEGSLEEAGKSLLRRTGHQAVLVTRGARGMCLFRRRRPVLAIPAYGSDEVADVTGAGDTVIAVFTLALVCGAAYDEAARLANYAAGLVVMKAGTATVGPDELRDAVREDSAT